MSMAYDLTGQTFHFLKVIKRKGSDKCQKALWECECKCGNIVIVTTGALMSGNTKSCGCWKKEVARKKNWKHGKSHTREFYIWKHAKQRISNPNDKDWDRYGGRGITMCDEWFNSFEKFLEDMGPCPPGYTIERKDNDGPYSSDNCIWDSRKNQGFNRENTIRLTFDGETMSRRQWTLRLKVSSDFIEDRLKKGIEFPEIYRQAREFVVGRHWAEDLAEA